MLKAWRVRRQRSGFTLVELMIVVALTALLATLALPGMGAIVQRVHRADALAALGRVQMLQQRHRSLHPRYATLAQLGIGETLAGGRYRLDASPPTASGYVLTALAQGAQAGDAACRLLRLEVSGADTQRSSGPDAETRNDAARNQRCWGG